MSVEHASETHTAEAFTQEATQEPAALIQEDSNQHFIKVPKAQEGQFDDEIPKDYLELSEQEVLQKIKEGQTIEKCFIRSLSLSGEFTKDIQLNHVFISVLNIHKAKVNGRLSLVNCQVRRMIIDEAEFQSSVSIKRSKFYFFHMKHSIVNEGFNAESARFRSKVLFQETVFEKRVRFWEATCADWFNALNCQFKARVDMRSATFEAGLIVSGSHFHDDFLFRGSHLALKWEGIEARFDQLIDFSKAKLGDFVYLEDIIQGEDQQWSFWNTVSERILVRPEQVEGRMKSEESKNYYEAMREYAVLKRSFEYENQYSYDDWAFYRFKVNERRARSTQERGLVARIIDFADWLLLDWGCGYGTHPIRAIRTALVMIVFFALVYTLGFSGLHSPENFPFPELPAEAFLNRLSVSLFVSLAAFTSGFGDLRDVAIGWMNIPIMIEALLGTLMWGLFIVAFGRKVIR